MAFSSYVQVVCVVALSFVALTTAFVVPAPAARPSAPVLYSSLYSSLYSPRCTGGRRVASRGLRMSEEEVVEEEAPAVASASSDAAEKTTQSVRSFFAPNENIRLGSSRDQDGKSNVWAVEPKMRVEGKDTEPSSQGNLAVVGGLVAVVLVAIVATVAFLPSPDSL